MAFFFNGSLKRIYITAVSEVTTKDLYSAWKDWVITGNNLQYAPAFRTIGGDPTVPGQYSPVYYFLINGWRIVIDGITVAFSYNLYTEEGTTPILTLNNATALLNNSDVGVIGMDTISILNALTIINEGIKKASKLIPHNTNI